MARAAMDTGGGTQASFPTTRWSVVRGAAGADAERCRASFEELACLYWKPVYAYFRRRWGRSHEDAKDLTQSFFESLLTRDPLKHLTTDHGRFRTYLMAALDNFSRMDHRRRMRQKRGGGRLHLPIEDEEGLAVERGETPERVFQREWARTLLEGALQALEVECRSSGRETTFRILLRRDVEPAPGEEPAYGELAREFGLTVPAVTNLLYRARRRLRELVLERVRDSVSTEEDLAREMRELFEDLGA